MRYALLLVLAVACYDAPDYGGTRFKCDADHGCPVGQTCVAGSCTGAGGPDATGASSVACGAAACGADQKCCSDFAGALSCIPLAATCNGFAATCDGTEDCAGDPCCADTSTIACATSCANQICLEPMDCKDPNRPQCCFDFGTNEPWGRCLAACP